MKVTQLELAFFPFRLSPVVYAGHVAPERSNSMHSPLDGMKLDWLFRAPSLHRIEYFSSIWSSSYDSTDDLTPKK
jgi:hypothetical protein